MSEISLNHLFIRTPLFALSAPHNTLFSVQSEISSFRVYILDIHLHSTRIASVCTRFYLYFLSLDNFSLPSQDPVNNSLKYKVKH